MPATRGSRRLLIAALAAGWAMALAGSATADSVTLKLRGGTFEVSGELLSTDGKTASINSPQTGLVVVEVKRFDCSGPGCAKIKVSEDFSIQGSNTIGAALMPALVEAYAGAENLRVEKRVGASTEEIGLNLVSGEGARVASIDLRSHGSGTAFPALANGTAEIGASSRPIKPEEEKTLVDSGLGVNAHVFALDGILVLVSPDNPINDLTLDQIAGIFSGQITDWSQLGAPAGPIAIYARDEKSGTTDTFKSLVLQPRNANFAASATRKESSVELSDQVAQDPRAIGFVGVAYLRNAKALNIRGECGITYIPTHFSIKTEEYPLSRRLFLYTTNRPGSPRAQSLLNYTLSDAAQPTILSSGFIDQSLDQLTFREQFDRVAFAIADRTEEFSMDSLKQLVTEIDHATRMSVTYRFEKSQYQLDQKARQDVSRLARYLQTPEMRSKETLLIGFADSAGPFAANLAISLARAETVRKAVLAAGDGKIDPTRITAKTFSETMPVDCNSTPDGRAKNRRVEVWVRDPVAPKAPSVARKPAVTPDKAGEGAKPLPRP